MRRNLIIFLILAFFVGCGPYIWFKAPQPQGEENLNVFPENLLGKYSSVSDTSIIRIETDKIISEYRENLLMTKAEFREETGDTISEDTSFTFTDNWDITIKSFGDSVKVFSSKDDELFKISDQQILREYKGIYFLNYKDTNDYWKVKILNLEKDTLEFDIILFEKDMENIRNITMVEIVQDSTEESTRYYLNPTKRELKKILKKRSTGEKFVKID
ncbi:MAG: hypothetical protein KOO66_06805 [Bacteroidales bacterium]|nr:hypothetical protein [Bacteroidales bacterium]